MSKPNPCWLVVRYRSYEQRFLHAICTTEARAEEYQEVIKRWCGVGTAGCKPTDKVYVEVSAINHLLGAEMFSA